MIDRELYNIASDWAEDVYHNIIRHIYDRHYLLKTEEKEICELLLGTGWFDNFPIDEDDSEFFTRYAIALLRYSYLKANPHKQKMKGWDIVQKELERIRNDICDDCNED